MGSTDGSNDDEERGEEVAEESVLPTGPRRSTYTPPTNPTGAIPVSENRPYDDDELANAIAADISKATTGATNVIYQLDDIAPSNAFGVQVEPLAAAPPGARIPKAEEAGKEAAPEPQPASPIIPEFSSALPAPGLGSVPVDLPPPEFTTNPDLPPPPVPPVPVPVVEPEPGSPADPPAAPVAPEPEPQQPSEPIDEVAALAQQSAPAGRPWIPERHSLRDDELSSLLEGDTDQPGGTLGKMDELERQLRLRDEESREFQEWQESMIAVGTPEALAAVERVLPEFTDIVADPQPTVREPQPPQFDASPPTMLPATLDATPSSFDKRSFGPPSPKVEPAVSLESAPPEPWPTVDGDVSPPHADEYPKPIFIDPQPVEPQATISEVPGTQPSNPNQMFAAPIPEPLVEPDPFSANPFSANPFSANPFSDSVYVNPVTGAVPVVAPQTGSLAIQPHELDTGADDDEPIDATDQVGFDNLLGGAPHPATAPVEPILSPRIPDDEVVLGEAQELERPRVFTLEQSELEPTPEEQRVGRAARMFWLWFAANSSIVSVAFGAMVFSLGMSLRQSIVGILAGIAVSFIPLGLGALAGKRSGLPTMVISRAAFGTAGNVVPAILSLLSRAFWGAAILWLLAESVGAVLDGAELTAGLSRDVIIYISLGVGLLLALLFAIFGYGFIARVQLIISILATVLLVGFGALTWSYIDISAALTFADGSWALALTAAVLVFSFVGLLWANSSSDLARYQRSGSSGAGTMLWTSFGTTVPPFLLISYGALLAASNAEIGTGLLENPLDTIGRMLPTWYPVPLIAASALSLLCGLMITLYSGGFALQAVGVRMSRIGAIIITAVIVGAVSFLLTTVLTDGTSLFRDFATTLAVPVAAWAGIFAADTMIRNRGYDSDSLLHQGGIYPSVNWVNLVMLFVISGVGFGLTTATASWLGWQGYIFTAFGAPLDGTIAGTDLGVFVALLLGLLTPIVSGIPRVRREERNGTGREFGAKDQAGWAK